MAKDKLNIDVVESLAYKYLMAAPKGTKIYLVLRHVSKSGMTRWIYPFVMVDGQVVHLGILGKIPDFPKYDYKRKGFKIEGCGMDMGFSLTYEIGMILHDDGYYFEPVWI